MHILRRWSRAIPAVLIGAAAPVALTAQVGVADYDRAAGLRERFEAPGLVTGVAEAPVWLSSGRFWYRTSVAGGSAFVLVDPAVPAKRPAFDHARLAGALGAVTRRTYAPARLPFTTFTFDDGEQSIRTGGEHVAGRRGPSASYGDRKLYDFFLRSLKGIEPPNWNAVPRTATRVGAAFDASTAFSGATGWDALLAGWDRDP